MADFRNHYEEIRAAGADLVAISVDTPEASEALRRQEGLPFALLCDTQKQVVKAWGIYNAGEKGGIAKPAAFIIGRDLVARFVSLDSVAARVPAPEILRILQSLETAAPARRRVYIPTFAQFVKGLGNLFKMYRRSRRAG